MMARTLRVTSPLMRGDDVAHAQRVLISAGFLSGKQDDGVYGPVTANAARRAKYVLGYKQADLTGSYGPGLHDLLMGRVKPTPAMRVRAANRRGKPDPTASSVGAAAADQMVSWFKAGWKEHPPGSNIVSELSDLARRLGLSSYYVQMRFPWCAFAVFTASLANGSKAAEYGLKRGLFNALYTPEIQTVANRGSFGLSAVSKANIVKGTGLLFDFDGGGVDHVGLALGAPGKRVNAGGTVWKPGKGEVVTVEGNTSFADSGSQSNGGCVAIRIRSLSVVSSAFRIT